MEKDRIILRTYGNVWKFQRKIYSIDKIRLIVPIDPQELGYFIVGVGMTTVFFKILPFLNSIPVMIRYGLIPFVIMKFLTKKKLDGKLPHKFLYGYLKYKIEPKEYARFMPVARYKKGKFRTTVSYRNTVIVNMTEKYLNKKEGSNRICMNFLSNIMKKT